MAEPPTWAGINLRTAENVDFASKEQLVRYYEVCIRGYGVPSGVVRAWMLHSHSGQRSADGMPDGEGSATICGGMRYTGMFKKGLMHGQGRLDFGEGKSYEGGFFYNCVQGTGKYTWQNGAHYVGEVRNGLFHGNGSLCTGQDGQKTYEGTWMKGLRHGEGSLVYGKEGADVYYGGWFSDRKHGDGNLIYASGSTYRGTWSAGKRHGQGRATVVTSVVPSDTKAAMMHRHWRLDATSIQIYDGEWLNDLPHGRGKDVWADYGVEEDRNILRNTYTGNFVEGKREGQGTYVYASGAVFKGQWKDNMKEGQGVLYYEDGKVHSGDFNRDRFIPVSGVRFPVYEPVEAVLEVLGIPEVAQVKPKVVNLFLRYGAKLRDTFAVYSKYQWKPVTGTEARYVGRPRAMLMDQLWQLCHDARIVDAGFGLAQVDFVLRAGPECAFASMYEPHFPKRQIIYREFLECMVKLANAKLINDATIDTKVEAFLRMYILGLSVPGKESPYTLSGSNDIRNVLDKFKPQLKQLFHETLRETGTSDKTIKILYLNLFFLRFAPELVANQPKLVVKLISGLYYKQLKEEDDNGAFLESDINFREFELCLLMIALEDASEPAREAHAALEALLKNVVSPNLAVSLELLLNEPPPPPPTGKKGDKAKPKK